MNAPQRPFGGDPEGHPLLLLLRIELERWEIIHRDMRRTLRSNILVLALIAVAAGINVGFAVAAMLTK